TPPHITALYFRHHSSASLSFFSHHPATTAIYTLSLHDALPIWICGLHLFVVDGVGLWRCDAVAPGRSRLLGLLTGRRESAHEAGDRKSTRLNSSHVAISYAVFCLKKKKDNSSLAEHYMHSMITL